VRYLLVLVCLAALVLQGCKSHLLFVEESHLALKAKFRADSATPFDVDLGYRRGMIALIPMQLEGGEEKQTTPPAATLPPPASPAPSSPTTKVLRVHHDPDELMSLYTVFKANIGFADPVEVCHFMATGVAATVLLSDAESLKALEKTIGRCSSGNNP
jgi:hypothetical protein